MTVEWRRETGIVADEEEHVVYLTNDARDTLILNADDVAHFVNAAIGRGEAFMLDGDLRLVWDDCLCDPDVWGPDGLERGNGHNPACSKGAA